MWKKIALVVVVLTLLAGAGGAGVVYYFSMGLPRMITVADYHPLLVTEVYDRNNEKFGEFFREKRMLLPYDQIPEKVVQAFVSAEDSTFFDHHGLYYIAMFR